MSKLTGGRFVNFEGKRILQLERSLWGGEATEWFTPETVEFDSLTYDEQKELVQALGTSGGSQS